MRYIKLICFLLLGSHVLFGQINLESAEIKLTNEEGINTKEIEYSPVFYQGGVVFITSQNEMGKYAITDINTGFNITSIYHATRDENDKLQNPTVFSKDLLSKRYEASLSFNTSSDVIYFTRNDAEQTTSSTNYLKKLNIYSAMLADGKWGNITPMSFNVDGYNTIHPSISPDMDELFFSSDRPGGYGGFDLYVVKKIGGEWSAPINLGPQVNTPKDEVLPFIHADGTLYFTSNGHGGQGGTDIFYAQRNRELWNRPVNLGEPFNSSANDLAFIVDRDNKNGYISSDRSGGKGSLDIYSFSFQKEDPTNSDEIMVSVIDAQSNEPLANATISYINVNQVVLPKRDGTEVIRIEKLSGDEKTFTFTYDAEDQSSFCETDEEGKCFFGLSSGEYAMKASLDGYIPMQMQFSIPTKSNNTFIIPLERAVDCVPIAGRVTVGENFKPQPGTEVVIKDIETGETIRAIVDAAGGYEDCLKCGREYQVFAQIDGISSEISTISTKDKACSESLTMSRQLTFASDENGMPVSMNGESGRITGTTSTGEKVAGAPVTEGSIILLPNIYFNFDDAGLRMDAYSDLDLVTKMLRMYPEMEIEIASHTDARGPDSYNQSLSERRSTSVVQYIVDQGISSDRVIPVGYGETKPRNRCVNNVKCPESLHRENRRTEVVIKSLGETYSKEHEDQETLEQISNYANGEGDSTKDGFVTPVPETQYDGTNKFYVIAGTFQEMNNANTQLEKLQDMGYATAEIIVFDYPKYYAVCADKYETESDANVLVDALYTDHSIEAYVRKME